MAFYYETLILASPEITSDETKALEENVERIVKKNEGSLKSFERWGKYRLAYPVRKHEYGVYFLGRFAVEDARAKTAINELHALFTVKFPQFVVRHMNHRLTTLEQGYQRPESLEETPSQDVESFLRDNHMNSLIKGGDRRGRMHAKTHEVSEEIADEVGE